MRFSRDANLPTREVQNIDLARAERLREACGRVGQQMAKAVVGQEETIEQLLIARLARGHCLLEVVPGLAKTPMIRSIGSYSGEQIVFSSANKKTSSV